jgi:hypothetical protein
LFGPDSVFVAVSEAAEAGELAARVETEATAANLRRGDLVLVWRGGAVVPAGIASNTRAPETGDLLVYLSENRIGTYVQIRAADVLPAPPDYPVSEVLRSKAADLRRAEAEAAAPEQFVPAPVAAAFRIERVDESAEEEGYGWRTAAVNARFPKGTPVYVVDAADVDYGMAGASLGPQYGLVHTNLRGEPGGRRGGIRWFAVSALGTEAPPPVPPDRPADDPDALSPAEFAEVLRLEETARAAPEAPGSSSGGKSGGVSVARIGGDAEPVLLARNRQIAPPPAAPRARWTTAATETDQDYGIPDGAPVFLAETTGPPPGETPRQAAAPTAPETPPEDEPASAAYIRNQFLAGYERGRHFARERAVSPGGELAQDEVLRYYDESYSYPYQYGLTRACLDYADHGLGGMYSNAAFAAYQHSRFYGRKAPDASDPDRIRALVRAWGAEEGGSDG